MLGINRNRKGRPLCRCELRCSQEPWRDYRGEVGERRRWGWAGGRAERAFWAEDTGHCRCSKVGLSLAGGKQKGWSTEGGDVGNEVGEEIS